MYSRVRQNSIVKACFLSLTKLALFPEAGAKNGVWVVHECTNPVQTTETFQGTRPNKCQELKASIRNKRQGRASNDSVYVILGTT